MKEFIFSKNGLELLHRKFITFIDEDTGVIVVEMENGKQIDAFLQPKEESYFIIWLHPTSNGNGKKSRKLPL